MQERGEKGTQRGDGACGGGGTAAEGWTVLVDDGEEEVRGAE